MELNRAGQSATLERSGLQVAPVGSDTVTSSNLALATSHDCSGCRTIAVALQAVFVIRDASTVSPTNAAVATNVDGARQKNAKRVRNGLLSLPKVAGLANVEQIVVFEREAGIVHDRAKVIAMKMADAIHPLFAFEAVDAAKGELVAEPRPELDGAAVAAWAVLATVWP